MEGMGQGITERLLQNEHRSTARDNIEIKLQSKLEKHYTHLLDFHVCTTCGSTMPFCRAKSSRKSNMYLTATGRTQPRFIVLNIVSNRLSTYCCRAPYGNQQNVRLTPSTPAVPNRCCSTGPAPYWSNPAIFNFWHSGALALSPERQSARMSEIKNAGLDQYGEV